MKAHEQAIRRFRNEARFKAVCHSVVARAMQHHGRIDPQRADLDASDVALTAVALLYETFLQDDQELRALREERDHYRRAYEACVPLSSSPQFLRLPTDGAKSV